MWLYIKVLILAFLWTNIDAVSRWREEKSKCPSVKSSKSFDFEQVGTSYTFKLLCNLSDSYIS